MSMPQFDSPLDDAEDDFRLALQPHTHDRMLLRNGLQKLVAYVRSLEERVAELELGTGDKSD